MPIIARDIYQGPHGPTNDNGSGKSPLLYAAGAVVSPATYEKLGKIAKPEKLEALAPLDAQKEVVKAAVVDAKEESKKS